MSQKKVRYVLGVFRGRKTPARPFDYAPFGYAQGRQGEYRRYVAPASRRRVSDCNPRSYPVPWLRRCGGLDSRDAVSTFSTYFRDTTLAAMEGPAILAENLTRRFGDLVAVDQIHLAIGGGQFFGFLGPNGAGKSTTIRMLTGLLKPTAGRIRIHGLDLEEHPIEVKRQIGVMPEGLALFDQLTGPEFLNFVGRMYALDRVTAAQRTADLLEFIELADRPKTLIADYSRGMKKKLALAAAVIHGPKILFLDEPFEGIDAIAAGSLKALLNRMAARGVTIFLTSHVLEIVERLCSHVAIIHKGKLVAQGSLEELRAGVEARIAVPPAASQAEVPAGTLLRETKAGEKLTLEQMFLEIVGGTRLAEQELSWLA